MSFCMFHHQFEYFDQTRGIFMQVRNIMVFNLQSEKRKNQYTCIYQSNFQRWISKQWFIRELLQKKGPYVNIQICWKMRHNFVPFRNKIMCLFTYFSLSTETKQTVEFITPVRNNVAPSVRMTREHFPSHFMKVVGKQSHI